MIHEKVETLLKGRLNNLTIEEYYLGTTHNVEDIDITVDQEMNDCANSYVEYIDQRVQELDNKWTLIVERVNMPEIHTDLWGTADAILIGKDTIEIIDLIGFLM